MPNDERILETMPDGALGLIPLKSCEELGAKVDQYLVGWREKREHAHKNEAAFKGYHRDSYIISTSVPRFGTGEAKGVIKESVRGYDLYLMVDVTNYSLTYSVSVTKTTCPQMTITLISNVLLLLSAVKQDVSQQSFLSYMKAVSTNVLHVSP